MKPRWWAVGLIIVIIGWFAPALNFGLIWDDPKWYTQATQADWQAVWFGVKNFQFYRPLVLLYSALWVGPNGIVNLLWAHGFQIAFHIGISLLVVPILQGVHFSTPHARLSALLFALSPFAWQAVAWQAAHQPYVMLALLLALFAAQKYLATQHTYWLAGSWLSYLVALLFQETALPFVVLFAWLAWHYDSRPLRQRWWVLGHGLLALGYLLIWLNVPRQSGITGKSFDLDVLAYLLQGVAFPVAHFVTNLPAVPTLGWIALFGLTTLGLVAIGHKTFRHTIFVLLWLSLALAPVWVGLSWDYVYVGERLLYPASIGIAMLWAGIGTWLFDAPHWSRKLVGGVVCAAVLVICGRYWQRMTLLYTQGTSHLRQAAATLAQHPNERLLFINFPDRLELQPAPFPLGYWGLTLAPIGQNLSDYAHALYGSSGTDSAASVFALDTESRAQTYHVDMRGSDHGPSDLWHLAAPADAVYVTRYAPNGDLQLQSLGAVRPADTSLRAPLARFGFEGNGDAKVELLQADYYALTHTLRLEWEIIQPLAPNDTVLIHLWSGENFITGFDGDAWEGTLPLHVWQPHSVLIDERILPLPTLEAGDYVLRVGIYNRASGERLSGGNLRNPQGTPDRTVPVAVFTVP